MPILPMKQQFILLKATKGLLVLASHPFHLLFQLCATRFMQPRDAREDVAVTCKLESVGYPVIGADSTSEVLGSASVIRDRMRLNDR